MSQRDRFTRDAGPDADSYGSLFDDDHDDHEDHDGRGRHDDHRDWREPGADGATAPATYPAGRHSRVDERRARRRGSRRRVALVLTGVVVLVLALVVWLVVLPVYRYLSPQDYSGNGTGSVTVTVHANDGAGDIADELKAKGVIASVGSFTSAADDNSRSRSIQPGTYRLHSHMSGAAALTLLLDPDARVDDDVVVTPGATVLDVAARLAAEPCAGGSASATLCGPGYSVAAVRAALGNVSALGIPPDFLTAGKAPASVEGLLYPATYFFPESSSPAAALQQMITQFADQLRSTDFTTAAKRNGFTPYQQLIAASIAQSEAKYPADMAKVVRVIMNRIASNTPLRIDATSAYAAKLAGKDPAKVVYATIDSPYNTYTHSGLPPTPISNPGSDALAAAARPSAGNWLFYVNKDAAGHLFFTNSESAFTKAVDTCRRNHWGCG